MNIKILNSKPVLFYLGILVFALLLYRNIILTYVYSDAYEFLLSASNNDFINIFIQHGRILYGFMNKLLFTSFNSVETVKYIRLISLLGSILYLFALFKILTKYNYSAGFSFLTILLFITMPSFSIILLWSATYQVSWGLLVSLLAGYIAVECKNNIYYTLLSVVLGIIALNLYQPSYTMFIIPLFVYWIKTQDLKSLIRPLLVHVFTYITYFLFYKLYLSSFGLISIERTGIEFNFFKSLYEFIRGPLLQALTFNFIFAPKVWLYFLQVIFLVVIIFANFKIVKGGIKKILKANFFRLTIVAAFFILSMLPNFLSVDKWVTYRTMNTLCLLLVINVMFFLTNKLIVFKRPFVLIFILVIISFFSASYNINDGFIYIQKNELQSMTSVLSNQVTNTTKIIYYKEPNIDVLPNKSLIERVVTDEFGRLSSVSKWVPKPMIKMISSNKKVSIISYNGQEVEDNCIYIDIGQEYLNSLEVD